MSLIDELKSKETWENFRNYKSFHSCMSNREMRLLDEFINGERYKALGDAFTPEGFAVSTPEKRVINKSGSRKKRVVYTFTTDEMYMLKLLTWLLYKYDDRINPSCYSFRRNMTAKKAIGNILLTPGLDGKYVLKADIHDYFNSMPSEGIVRALQRVITDDDRLLEFLTKLFSGNEAFEKAEGQEKRKVCENRGAMAGVPVSAFIANIYLEPLDSLFESLGNGYYRYSDDILIFADTKEELLGYKNLLKEKTEEAGLKLNEEKTKIFEPGEGFEFLGIKYKDGETDLADATVKKMKDKIRRKCRSLYRWRKKKDFDFDKAAKVVIRIFNMKYFDTAEMMDFTWSRWFFPVLTTDRSLKILDAYLVNELRYIHSGRHYKGNYAVTYEHLKELGFLSLVNEYHKWKENR